MALPNYTQDGRLITIDSPLGPDVLLLERFDLQDALSRQFHAALDVLSMRDDIAADEIVGKKVDFTLRQADESLRYFNGYVRRIVRGEPAARDLRRYHLEVVPWLWFLTQTSDCRIFQEKTLPDIIEEVFADCSFNDYRLSLSGTHPQHEYCVQYRESDFDFVSRLMEEEGIFYYWDHDQGRHTMVLADSASSYQNCEERALEFSAGDFTPNHVSSWARGFAFRSGRWAQTDYNFEDPQRDLGTSAPTLVRLAPNTQYERFDYPGRYDNRGDGDSVARVRMEEVEVGHETMEAESGARTLFAGGKSSLTRHVAASEEDASFVITEIRHLGVNETYIDGAGGATTYSNRFIAIPDSGTFRPPRVTELPIVAGLQTAEVVGPSGEEIYTDEYGRIKVQFHWDRYGENNERSSCWIRVAQDICGRNWGHVVLPRIGQEVVVAFLEGDPDQPLVIGAVYNGDMKPPYELPANKTQLGLKTRSSKGGGASDFNELRFEDKAGEEQVYFHAQKDFDRVVENDDTLEVGNDQTITITNNRTETVEQGNETVTIGQGNRSITVSQGDDTHEVSQGNRTVTVAMGDDTLDVSMGSRSVSAGQNVTVEANMSIELKVGANKITINQSGITIQGMMVTVEGTASTTVKSGGMVTIQAPLVKIN